MSALLAPFGSPAGEAERAALVAVAFVALFALAEAWRRAKAPPVEWTRKLVHVGAGAVCAAFPWLFARPLTVLLLTIVSATAVWIAGRRGWVPAVTNVQRVSRGEVLFPLGVCLLFVLAHDQAVFYLVGLSALVLSDTAAALIGRAYGRHGFGVGDDTKSFEGSVVFWLVTFLGTHVLLLLGSDLGRVECLLVAAQVALLLACFEAISVSGSDNLVVPLGAYYLLVKMAAKPVPVLALQLGVQLGLLVAVALVAWRTRFLTASGAVAAHLVLYAAFSLGGPAWTLAPLGALGGFLVLDDRLAAALGRPPGGHQVRAIYWTSIVAVVVLFVANSLASLPFGLGRLPILPALQAAFVGALAASLSIAARQLVDATPRLHAHRPALRLLGAFAFGAVAVILPGCAMLLPSGGGGAVALSALVSLLALALERGLRGRARPQDGTIGRLRVAAFATLAAVVVALAGAWAWAALAGARGGGGT